MCCRMRTGLLCIVGVSYFDHLSQYKVTAAPWASRSPLSVEQHSGSCEEHLEEARSTRPNQGRDQTGADLGWKFSDRQKCGYSISLGNC